MRRTLPMMLLAVAIGIGLSHVQPIAVAEASPMSIASDVVADATLAARPGNIVSLLTLLNGTPTYVDTTAVSTTAATITATAGSVIRIQCDVAVYVYIPGTATAAIGEMVAQNDPYTLLLPDDDGTVSVITGTGSGSCKRWNLR